MENQNETQTQTQTPTAPADPRAETRALLVAVRRQAAQNRARWLGLRKARQLAEKLNLSGQLELIRAELDKLSVLLGRDLSGGLSESELDFLEKMSPGGTC